MPVETNLPPNVHQTTDALTLILLERARQKVKWGVEHDDGHEFGEMAVAAAAYALEHTGCCNGKAIAEELWPFASCEREPKTPLENLIRAGALIVAEIERLKRAELSAQSADKGTPHD